MFVHWDHASQQGLELSWPLVGSHVQFGEDIPSVAAYHASAATFDPQQWDAKDLAALAKQAGATYVVFTAKHHSGYAMFHTKHSDHSIEHSPFGRDVLREYTDAVRAEGLKVGVYFSLCDWGHADYPAFTDAMLPYQHRDYPRPPAEQWARYLDFLKAQLREVLTEYGQIDLLWFDGEWERTAAEWDAAGLREFITSLQPDVVINDRLPEHGDYATPEQGFPSAPIDGPWELCLTMGDQWGYSPLDHHDKSPTSLVITLIEAAAHGGNLLLNLGPKPDGTLKDVHRATFEAIGDWLAVHGESIQGASPTQGVSFFGPTTATDQAIYLHLAMRPIEQVVARGIPIDRIDAVTLLATGEELSHRASVDVHGDPGEGVERTGTVTIEAPQASGALVDVIKISLSDG